MENKNKPIAICSRTGTYVYPTTSKGYYGYCPVLDEDLYLFETEPLDGRLILNYDSRHTPVYYRNDNGDIEQCTYAEFVREFGGDETTTPNGVAPRKFVREIGNGTFDVMEWRKHRIGCDTLSNHATEEEAEQELFEYWESYMNDSDQTPYYTADKNDTDL